ncbi:hypothetical protein DXG01_002419 [Tephrocybe rancida]|nr:hypothetical protein DXG01_002419 [Tephrocybe rancida]
MDTFHLLIGVLLDDLASARGAALAVESEHMFGVVFVLLEVPASASSEDARVDVLQSVPLHKQKEGPGALTILLRSSIPPSIDTRRSSKECATERVPSPHDPHLDLKLTQILDILLDTSPSYACLLIRHPAYSGDPEQVIGALLDGSAPLPESAKLTLGAEVEVEAEGKGGEVAGEETV